MKRCMTFHYEVILFLAGITGALHAMDSKKKSEKTPLVKCVSTAQKCIESNDITLNGIKSPPKQRSGAKYAYQIDQDSYTVLVKRMDETQTEIEKKKKGRKVKKLYKQYELIFSLIKGYKTEKFSNPTLVSVMVTPEK